MTFKESQENLSNHRAFSCCVKLPNEINLKSVVETEAVEAQLMSLDTEYMTTNSSAVNENKHGLSDKS